MSNPFTHSALDKLEASTAMTTLSDTAMDHAAQDAARQVQAAVSFKPQKLKRAKASAVASGPVIEPSREAEAGADPAPEGVEASPGAMAPLAGGRDEAAAAPHEGEATPSTLDALPRAAPDPASTLATEAPLLDAPSETPRDAAALTDAAMTPPRPHDADPMRALGDSVVRTIQSNIEASVSLWMSMMDVSSPSEAILVNADHLCRQVDRFVAQCREVSALSRAAAMQVFQPFQASKL